MKTYCLYTTEAKPIENIDNMNISEEFLEVVRLSFQAKSLIKNDSKSSKEKYKMIKAIEDKMDILFHSVSDVRADAKFDDIVILAVAYYNLGLVYVNSKEDYELHTAFIYFKTCLDLLQGKELDCKAILTYISVLNEINSVFYKIEKDKYTYKFLKSAMEVYLEYTKENNYPDPIHITRIFDIEEKESNPKIILEILHFTTLRDIATQYFVQPEDKHQFIIYMHNLLKDKLSEMMSKDRKFRENYLDWALTLFDMSRYFLVNNRFVEARNYLATADYITYRFSEDTLKKINQQKDVSNNISNNVSNNVSSNVLNNVSNNNVSNVVSNDISKLRFIYLSDSYDYVCGVSAKSWGTYGVVLLRFWLEKFLQNKNEQCESDDSELKIESEEQSTNLLIFFDLRNETEHMADQITHTCVLDLADAKSVFMKILKHLDVAKAYFTIDSDIETYAKITLEISAAYKYLAGFEHNKDIQLKLHKRRVEYLENVCKKFHTIIDIDTEFQTYKRVWYEVVTSCSTIMDLMLEKVYHNESKNISKEVDRYAKLILGNIDLYLHVT